MDMMSNTGKRAIIPNAGNEAPDQPAHARSLIRDFVPSLQKYWLYGWIRTWTNRENRLCGYAHWFKSCRLHMANDHFPCCASYVNMVEASQKDFFFFSVKKIMISLNLCIICLSHHVNPYFQSCLSILQCTLAVKDQRTYISKRVRTDPHLLCSCLS